MDINEWINEGTVKKNKENVRVRDMTSNKLN